MLDFQLIVLDPPVSSWVPVAHSSPTWVAGAMAWGPLVPPVAPHRVNIDLDSKELPHHLCCASSLGSASAAPGPGFCLFSHPQVEESESEWSVPHCFTIYAAQKTMVVAAR